MTEQLIRPTRELGRARKRKEDAKLITGQTTWTIDPKHSLVELSVKHMMFTTVKGRFADVTGTIVLDEANPANSSVTAEIAAAKAVDVSSLPDPLARNLNLPDSAQAASSS